MDFPLPTILRYGVDSQCWQRALIVGAASSFSSRRRRFLIMILDSENRIGAINTQWRFRADYVYKVQRAGTHVAVALTIALLFVVSSTAVSQAAAAPTSITAYKSTVAVNVKAPYSSAQWTDAQAVTDQLGNVVPAKQNVSGWLFYMTWPQGGTVCADSSCYGGIELAATTNNAVMGSTSTPALMILGSLAFQTMVGHSVDEFISTGLQTPVSAESGSFVSQSVCGTLTLTGSTYSVQCYRPFARRTHRRRTPQDRRSSESARLWRSGSRSGSSAAPASTRRHR